MPEITLIIGNKNYSSWSLRGWLALKRCDVHFEEILISLSTPQSRAHILRYSKAGLVPILKHNGLTLWDSLAICEYLAETFPDAQLWPADPAARAVCRAVACEMHAGFTGLRTHMPMDVRNRFPGKGMAPGVQEDIDRIVEIWQDCRDQFAAAGPFLFGPFTVADAMFAPVVSRFITYGVELPVLSQSYCEAVWNSPDMVDWRTAADQESWVIDQ